MLLRCKQCDYPINSCLCLHMFSPNQTSWGQSRTTGLMESQGLICLIWKCWQNWPSRFVQLELKQQSSSPTAYYKMACKHFSWGQRALLQFVKLQATFNDSKNTNTHVPGITWIRYNARDGNLTFCAGRTAQAAAIWGRRQGCARCHGKSQRRPR